MVGSMSENEYRKHSKGKRRIQAQWYLELCAQGLAWIIHTNTRKLVKRLNGLISKKLTLVAVIRALASC